MVRKIDELGRVVLPKEMRRILNIKPGSSVEMIINKENQIVLYKFSEIENIFCLAEILGRTIFERLDLKCLICDDDKVLGVFGESKKEYLHKKVLLGGKINKKSMMLCDLIEVESKEVVSVYPIKNQGIENGFVVVFGANGKEEYINLLIDFFSKLID